MAEFRSRVPPNLSPIIANKVPSPLNIFRTTELKIEFSRLKSSSDYECFMNWYKIQVYMIPRNQENERERTFFSDINSLFLSLSLYLSLSLCLFPLSFCPCLPINSFGIFRPSVHILIAVYFDAISNLAVYHLVFFNNILLIN